MIQAQKILQSESIIFGEIYMNSNCIGLDKLLLQLLLQMWLQFYCLNLTRFQTKARDELGPDRCLLQPLDYGFGIL